MTKLESTSNIQQREDVILSESTGDLKNAPQATWIRVTVTSFDLKMLWLCLSRRMLVVLLELGKRPTSYR
jgi:hypothetical protein